MIQLQLTQQLFGYKNMSVLCCCLVRGVQILELKSEIFANEEAWKTLKQGMQFSMI